MRADRWSSSQRVVQDAVEDSALTRPWSPATGKLLAAFSWHGAALTAVTALSTFLNAVALNQEGYANTYYAATVRSMLENWHNFFYASFDPGGFVAVDKPPLGLWVQVASAKIFGFGGVSLLLPQALAGVLSVLLLYWLVKHSFGPAAGIFAALALAITPISVVDSRNNTSDSVLILVLLLAAWAVTRAIERSQLRWLILCAVFIGLGFNVKGFEAYLAMPALALVYLIGGARHWWSGTWHLLLAGLTTLVVSFSWIVAVDLTPASQRPYVSDSGTNSELSLALGYNGLGRLATGIVSHLSSIPLLHVSIDFTIVPGISTEIGNPSVLRLLEPAIGGQASWLLPLALIGLLVAAIHAWHMRAARRELVALALWACWLGVAGAFFTVARFYHLYYLNLLGPPIAALSGVGVVALWKDYREGRSAAGAWWQGWLLPTALVVTAIAQAHLLAGYTGWNPWLGPVISAICIVVAIALVCGRVPIRLSFSPGRVVGIGQGLALMLAAAGAMTLLLAPGAFAAESVSGGNGAAWLPQAGPSIGFAGFPGGARRFGRPFGGFGTAPGPGSTPSFGGGPPSAGGFTRGGGTFGFRTGGFGGAGALTFAGAQIPSLGNKLIHYLEQHRGHARYLVATPTSSYASLFILETGQPVMTLGGYQGWDRILSRTNLANLVSAGTVRFFLLSESGGPAGFGGHFGGSGGGSFPGGVDANLNSTNNDLFSWVQSHCSAVPVGDYQSTASNASRGGFGFPSARPRSSSPGELYDCGKA